jgi:HD-like signal output (HDOD) protein
MKLTNSSFFGLRLKAQSVDHAVNLIGTTQTGILMTGIIARQSVTGSANTMAKFWDFSSKRAQALSAMVRRIPVCTPDIAHTFGLFCDIGVPILMERFPDYADTWKKANSEFELPLTEVEDQRHITNHASIGSLMARTWGLQEQISTAILLHHDYKTLEDTATDEGVRGLIALSTLAEYAIQKYEGEEISAEWHKGGAMVCQYLGMSLGDAEDWCEELQDLFNTTH